jgi:SAM-dependent methyltransferase
MNTLPIRRAPDDLVPPAEFPRYALDRDFSDVNGVYLRHLGPEDTPLQIAIDRYSARGTLDLLDAGCGTGNTLRGWRQAVIKIVGDTAVSATGADVYDYSDESGRKVTRDAWREKVLKPIVDNIADMEVPDDSLDVVLSHNALGYNRAPDRLVLRLLRSIRPGGSLIFNIGGRWIDESGPLLRQVRRLHSNGYSTIYKRGTEPSVREEGGKTLFLFCRITKPGS